MDVEWFWSGAEGVEEREGGEGSEKEETNHQVSHSKSGRVRWGGDSMRKQDGVGLQTSERREKRSDGRKEAGKIGDGGTEEPIVLILY